MTKCPINLDCSMMPQSPGGYCENNNYCYYLSLPWPLPYYRDYWEDAMVVSISAPQNFLQEYTEEVEEAGYFEAQKLPYSGKKGHLEVTHYNRDLGFYPAEELPYKWEDGMIVVEARHGFRVAHPLPYDIDKSGLIVTGWIGEYRPAEKLPYNRTKKCLRVIACKGGFARAWPLSSKLQHHHKGKPLLTAHYPKPNNWLFKKELTERGLKLRPGQKPSAYFVLYSRYIALWDAGECSLPSGHSLRSL